LKTSLLARFAENLFWLARYVERAENTARILEVTETFTHDARGDQDWQSILEINSDVEAFREAHTRTDIASIVHFYMLDPKNTTSIRSSIAAARFNARALRHLISTEMWNQINVFQASVAALRRRDVTPAKLAGVCKRIRESCQAHSGITEGTLYRDESWSFYWIGRTVERADQTSRLVDIGYRRALASEGGLAARAQDSHWGALLRSASAYQAFRRAHPVSMSAPEVVRFLFHDGELPRSLTTALADCDMHMERLAVLHDLETSRAARDILRDVRRVVASADVGSLIDPEAGPSGLHGFVDDVQQRLTGFTETLGRDCFAHDE
jgi:uncharacterized alpha-E superfamily protein